MWDLKILGIDLYHILAWLFLYSFLGWLWESCYVSIKNRKLVNRGFVTGPVCTIYGVGAVSVYLILHPFERNLVALYFGGVIVATTLEYITAVIMENIFHASWWDYSNQKFNFQGRICLGCSAGWGVFTLVMFKVLHPFVEKIVGLFSVKTGQMILVMVMILYAIDFGFAMASALRLRKKLEQVEQAATDFVEHLQQSRIYSSASELLESMETHREILSRLNLKERAEKYQELMAERVERITLTEQKEAAYRKLKVLHEKLSNATLKGSWNSRRFMKAYPNLRRVSRVHRKLEHLSRMEKKNRK